MIIKELRMEMTHKELDKYLEENKRFISEVYDDGKSQEIFFKNGFNQVIVIY